MGARRIVAANKDNLSFSNKVKETELRGFQTFICGMDFLSHQGALINNLLSLLLFWPVMKAMIHKL
jgi:hypothetical protein